MVSVAHPACGLAAGKDIADVAGDVRIFNLCRTANDQLTTNRSASDAVSNLNAVAPIAFME